MNQSPILYEIARNIHCLDTLMSFMLTSKKCLGATKKAIRDAPTLFVSIHEIETSGISPSKVIWSSLKELYQELYQARLNDPYDNYSGPCWDCLSDLYYDYGGCVCNDVEYLGIKMIKYFGKFPPEINREHRWRLKITPVSGLVISSWISNSIKSIPDYRTISHDKPYDNTVLNYESTEYLYYGRKYANIYEKLGITIVQRNRMSPTRYYPATTEILDRISMEYLMDEKAKFGPADHNYMEFRIHLHKNIICRDNTI